MPRRRLAIALALLAALSSGCGHGGGSGPVPGGAIPAGLLRGSRPIGRGPRFQPPVRGPVARPCLPGLGRRYGVHVEVFLADRVVVVPRGIGVRGPVRLSEGRVAGARCFGALVTLEPTGVVLVRQGSHLHLGDLFRSWGESLGGFPRAYVGGRPVTALAAQIPLTRHAEIVVEAGPYVPPHRTYTFPPGA